MNENLPMPEGVKILIKPEEVSEKTDGGIYLPDSTQQDEKNATTKGEVLAIGPSADAKFEDGPIDVGDRVIYARYGGVLVETEEGDFRIVNDEDIIAKIK
jgi:chaperonin GroES